MNAVHILLLICPISLAVLRAPDVRCWAEFSSADAGFRHWARGRTAGGQQTHRSRTPKTNQAGTRQALPHCRADARSAPGPAHHAQRRDTMRYLFASFWLALLLCAGISLPATAQTSGRVYGGGHEQWTDGTIYWHGQGAQRRRLARTHSDDGDYRVSRRYRGYDADEDRTYRRRYAKKRSHTRTA